MNPLGQGQIRQSKGRRSVGSEIANGDFDGICIESAGTQILTNLFLSTFSGSIRLKYPAGSQVDSGKSRFINLFG